MMILMRDQNNGARHCRCRIWCLNCAASRHLSKPFSGVQVSVVVVQMSVGVQGSGVVQMSVFVQVSGGIQKRVF